MRIIKDFSTNYFDDPISYLWLNKLTKKKSKLDVYYGSKCIDSVVNKKRFNIYLDFEEPNWYWLLEAGHPKIVQRILNLYPIRIIQRIFNLYLLNYPRNFESKFDKILTICPYTADYINKVNQTKKREFIFFPFNQKFIFKKKKNIDVIYTGNIHGNILEKISKIISNYKYRIVSFSNNKYVTDKNISYKKKIKLIASSKISIIHNLLFLNNYCLKRLSKYKDLKKNNAFKYISKKIVPQQKSRMFEAAFSKSLMLVKKDPWNIIEYFFTPNKDFVYFEKEKDLPKLIETVLKNYNLYKPIVNSAFKKANKNYTVKAFYKKYLLKYEFKNYYNYHNK
jgi:hypothetical protein